ncbi:MAG: PA2169 family four-helix-bundle protein [Nonlabens sp.]
MESTKEHADKKLHENRVEALNDLLQKNYESEQGYKNALTDTNSPRLKTYFQKQAAQRSQYINELDKAVRDLNAEPAKSGGATAAIHRTWMDFKTAITGKSDEAVLEECIRGDKNAVAEYEEVLMDASFPEETRRTVQYQLNGIKNTLDTIKRLEDIVD